MMRFENLVDLDQLFDRQSDNPPGVQKPVSPGGSSLPSEQSPQ